MSVYRPAGSETFVYDFQLRGRRFYGATGCKNRRDAEAVERRQREHAKEELKRQEAHKKGPMTLDVACARYWIEVGQHHKRPDQTEWSLAYLIEKLGKDTLVRDIGDSQVAQLVAMRRGEFVTNKAAEKRSRVRPSPRKPKRRVSASTVNRSTTEPLRKVLNRARDVWEQEVKKIGWRKHMLAEPQERTRALTGEEEARLFDALNPRYHDVVRFAIRTGLRLSECVNLKWAAIDWGNRCLTVKGKRDKVATVPLPVDVRDLLWRQRGEDDARVFGVTISGLDTAFGRALAKAEITNTRFHDLRHTAATRLLRKTGNLRMVQKMLRHNDITTTVRYAHVLDDELRDAMDAVGVTASPVENPSDGSEVVEKKGLT